MRAHLPNHGGDRPPPIGTKGRTPHSRIAVGPHKEMRGGGSLEHSCDASSSLFSQLLPWIVVVEEAVGKVSRLVRSLAIVVKILACNETSDGYGGFGRLQL